MSLWRWIGVFASVLILRNKHACNFATCVAVNKQMVVIKQPRSCERKLQVQCSFTNYAVIFDRINRVSTVFHLFLPLSAFDVVPVVCCLPSLAILSLFRSFHRRCLINFKPFNAYHWLSSHGNFNIAWPVKSFRFLTICSSSIKRTW